MLLTNRECALRLQIASLEKEIAIAKLQRDVAHEQSLAIHREANAKLQVKIGELMGEISGLKVIDARNGECPTCKATHAQLISFMEKLSQTIEHWTPTSPAKATPDPKVVITPQGVLTYPSNIAQAFGGSFSGTATR
jgi:hypothetical protein